VQAVPPAGSPHHLLPKIGATTLQTSCGNQTLLAFLAQPDQPLDSSCKGSLTVDYELPGAVTPWSATDRARVAFELRHAPIPRAPSASGKRPVADTGEAGAGRPPERSAYWHAAMPLASATAAAMSSGVPFQQVGRPPRKPSFHSAAAGARVKIHRKSMSPQRGSRLTCAATTEAPFLAVTG